MTRTGTACTTNWVCEHAQLIALLSTLKSLKYDSLPLREKSFRAKAGTFIQVSWEFQLSEHNWGDAGNLTELRA